jgi:hypothetical protein
LSSSVVAKSRKVAHDEQRYPIVAATNLPRSGLVQDM